MKNVSFHDACCCYDDDGGCHGNILCPRRLIEPRLLRNIGLFSQLSVETSDNIRLSGIGGGVSSVTVATETGFIESYMLSWELCVGGGGRGFLTTLE